MVRRGTEKIQAKAERENYRTIDLPHRIDYADFYDNHLPIGSGVTEAAAADYGWPVQATGSKKIS
ncbi:MAG: hypothetical protein D3925_16890 [Candidatus Electrothrix sp. AR5]|nr:hypothetical protein [Candidatus Electrothrix sp. AR5]